jgi:glycerate kinase
VRVATDVSTRFLDAARVFGPQKGAGPRQVELLERRLHTRAGEYRAEFGVDVTTRGGGGAAGGLAGGLAALGAGIEPGFALVADLLALPGRVRAADLVVTGEGRLDATSSAGKAVGSLAALCAESATPCRILAGSVAPDAEPELAAITLDLGARFGRQASLVNPLGCVRAAVAGLLAAGD